MGGRGTRLLGQDLRIGFDSLRVFAGVQVSFGLLDERRRRRSPGVPYKIYGNETAGELAADAVAEATDSHRNFPPERKRAPIDTGALTRTFGKLGTIDTANPLGRSAKVCQASVRGVSPTCSS